MRVIDAASSLDHDDPAYIALRRQTGKLYKDVKRQSRKEKRQRIADADRAVVAATATGAPDRIDDETRGIPLQARTAMPFAGELIKARACYICKEDYTLVDAFYHQLCPDCASMSHEKRDARTDLTGRRALLTGGRAKIGMYIALRLLRDGAHTTITTRFPRDAVRRFSSLPDSADWLHRLKIVGIDLRDPAQVIGLTESVASEGPLDILINNAAQTVRRSPGAYKPWWMPSGALPRGGRTAARAAHLRPHTNGAHPLALAQSVSAHPILASAARTADELTAEAMAAGFVIARAPDGRDSDRCGRLIPDEDRINSWTQHVDQVEPIEMLEVQLANMTAPFLLVSRLRPRWRASTSTGSTSSTSRRWRACSAAATRAPGHPHTNMAKAALNMLTRTRAPARCSSRTASS